MLILGMMDETSRKNARDPPLLSTPKKRIGGSDDVGLDSPDKLTLTTLEAWNAMNEVCFNIFCFIKFNLFFLWY